MLPNLLLYSVVIFLLQFMLVDSDNASLARPPTTISKDPECQTKCGNVTVPYPFGIGLGSDCSKHPLFHIMCNTSFNPPKAFIGDIEVTDIPFSQMRIKNQVSAICYDQFGSVAVDNQLSMSLSPLTSFSDRNNLTIVGCDDFSLISDLEIRQNLSVVCVSICAAK